VSTRNLRRNLKPTPLNETKQIFRRLSMECAGDDAYKTALELESNGSMGEAATLFEEAANGGHSGAMLKLAHFYKRGQLVDKDECQSLYWCGRAVDAGVKGVAKPIGKRFEYGTDTTKKNERTAFSWYKRGAEAGDLDAIRRMAMCFSNARGTVQDHSKAFSLYSQGSKLGDKIAIHFMAVCYSNGDGVEKDVVMAANLFLECAENGVVASARCMGTCYSKGTGVQKNDKKAFQYYEWAAGQGDKDSKYKVSICYYFGCGVDRDVEKFAQLTLQLFDVWPCPSVKCALAELYLLGIGIDKDVPKALEMLRELAYQDEHATGRVDLTDILMDGVDTPHAY